jgi:hypothetical protein
MMLACVSIMSAGVVILLRVKVLGGFELISGEDVRWDLIINIVVFAAGGTFLLGVAIEDFWSRRDPPGLLLLLWVVGTLVFASFINWTTSGRSILPLVPAAGILLMRKVERSPGPYVDRRASSLFLPAVAGLVIAISVAWADYALAGSARTAAGRIYEEYSKKAENIWFMGHLGFQYYMENAGAKAVDLTRSRVSRGDIIVVPLNNPPVVILQVAGVAMVEEARFSTSRWFSTMSRDTGAGFYSSRWGPVPYLFGRTYDEIYLVMTAEVDIPFRFRPREVILKPPSNRRIFLTITQ